MRALSIQQPWAWAILHAGKDIENRKWATKFRGRILVHAGKRIDPAGFAFLQELNITAPPTNDLPVGGFCGEVDIVDCVTKSNSRWFFGPYGFVLKNAKSFPLIPGKGMLGLYEAGTPSTNQNRTLSFTQVMNKMKETT